MGSLNAYEGQASGRVVKFDVASGEASMLTAPELRGITPDVSAHAGADVTLSVAVLGTGDIDYQWKLGTMDIAGATGPSLQLSNIQAMQAGSYTVVITDERDTITSPAISVTVDGMGGAGVSYADYAQLIDWMGMDSTPGGNPDKDPFNNFQEFVFGLNPLVADTEPTHKPRAVLFQKYGKFYPAVKFRRRRNRGGFQIVIEAVDRITSQQMQMTTDEGVTDIGDDVDEATVRGQISIDQLQQLFFRIKLQNVDNN